MPMIHSHIYGEVALWALPSREFRILVAPSAVTTATRESLLDIDALDVFLRSRPGPPCTLRFFSVGTEEAVRRRMAGLTAGASRIQTEPRAETIARVRAAVGEHATSHVALVTLLAYGVEAGVDVVIPEIVPTEPDPVTLARALDLAILDWSDAKRACEVFVRGHEVPWAFAPATMARSWGQPWLALYPLTEPPERLHQLLVRATECEVDHDTRSLIHTLTMNRHPALAFTRDRLLFYVQQQRSARRLGMVRQNFSFEIDYYLNHYYYLLWGGLDQLCWIMNGVLGLGFTKRQHSSVGIAKRGFLERLHERASNQHALVTAETFVQWRKIIGAVRHNAAHRGVTMASELYFTNGTEPTDTELDLAVDASEEWQITVRALGREIAEASRGVLRLKERLRRLERAPERVVALEIEGRQAFVFPLPNIEHDFTQFMEFASKVASSLVRFLDDPRPA